MPVLPRDAASAAAYAAQSESTSIGVFSAMLLAIGATCMVLRFVARKWENQELQRDDWTFLAGGLLAEGLFIVQVIYAFDAGLGSHWSTLTPAQKALFMKLNYAENIFTLTSYPLIKLSILFFYLRIFVSVTFRRFVWAGIVFVTCMMIANTLVTIFACNPIRSFFDTTVAGTCVSLYSFYWATAICTVVTDIYILTIPLPLVWKMNATVKKKIGLTIVFVLGGLTFVISIMRIVFYLQYDASDPSYSFNPSSFANPGEICLGLIVASITTWRPIYFRSISTARSVYNSVTRSLLRSSKTDLSADRPSDDEKDAEKQPPTMGVNPNVVPTWASRELDSHSLDLQGHDSEPEAAAAEHTKRWKFHD